MKFLLLSSLVFSASAFLSPSLIPSANRCTATTVFSTETEIETTTDAARDELMKIAMELKDEYGVLLIDTKAKDSFREAVEKLESVAEDPSDSSLLVGDWTLVCSSASSSAAKNFEIDTSKIPFLKEGPLKDIKTTLNDSIRVQQRIKFGESSQSIDAIDHVIEYTPPNQLSSFVKNLPDAIKNLDINPLKVSDTKVVLKHKAEVEGVVPVIKTKLSLEAIVVNVAGESKNLAPTGEDVLGINIPFGEFLNAGSFDTTYLDDSMRISRGKVGPVDQIRVFVKTSAEKTTETSEDAPVEAAIDEDDDLDDDEIVEEDEEVDGAFDAEIVEEKKETPEEEDDDDMIEAPSDIN